MGFQTVQLAKQLKVKVIRTASSNDRKILEKAGITKVIDYKNKHFERMLKQNEVDYVFDILGGETLIKSISLVQKKLYL